MAGSTQLDDPILNSPYDPPERHFEVGPNGPTGNVRTGRRPSESHIPIPGSIPFSPPNTGEIAADVITDDGVEAAP